METFIDTAREVSRWLFKIVMVGAIALTLALVVVLLAFNPLGASAAGRAPIEKATHPVTGEVVKIYHQKACEAPKVVALFKEAGAPHELVNFRAAEYFSPDGTRFEACWRYPVGHEYVVLLIVEDGELGEIPASAFEPVPGAVSI